MEKQHWLSLIAGVFVSGMFVAILMVAIGPTASPSILELIEFLVVITITFAMAILYIVRTAKIDMGNDSLINMVILLIILVGIIIFAGTSLLHWVSGIPSN